MHGRGPGHRLDANCLCIALTLVTLAPAGAKSGPGVLIADPATRFVHQQWTVEDGLPVNNLTDVVQTPDGWLWIASFDGLVRFDGVRFTRFDTVAAPALGSNRIVQLEVDAGGGLYVLSELGHLSRFAGGRLDAVEAQEGNAPAGVQMTVDGDGALWLATRRGLYRAEDARLIAGPRALRDLSIHALGTSARGRLWLATDNGRLAWVEDGEPRWVETDMERYRLHFVEYLAEDRDGNLWIGTDEGLFQWRGGRAAPVPDLELARRSVATGRLTAAPGRDLELTWHQRPKRFFLLRGPQGSLWEGAGTALLRDGRELMTLATGPDAGVWKLAFDHEGTVWIATNNQGLHALRPARVATLSETEGLPHHNIYPIHQDLQGAVWIGDAAGGLTRIDPTRADPAGIVTFHRTELNTPPLSLYADPRSGLMLTGDRVLASVTGNDWLPLADVSSASPAGREIEGGLSIRAIHRARDGRLYLGTEHGLFTSRRDDPRADGWQFRQIPGTAQWRIRALLEDSGGALWLGTNGTGVARYRAGLFHRVTSAEGLSSDLVRAIHQDSEGGLWIATEDRGLCHIDPASLDRPLGPEVAVIGKRDGLWDNALHQILEDDAGWLWLSTNRGIFRVRRSQLEDFIAGRVSRVDSVAYTEQDGMRHREANGGVQSAGIRSRDGRLWFPTQDGVVILDPAELVHELSVPPVDIERLSTGNLEVVPDDSEPATVLKAGERSFEIEYTTLSYRAPDRVRFRYRLEGYDEQWVEAGGRREAFYTKVPPGTYRFQVQARSAEGVWNRDGASLALTVSPFFWETGWFRGAVALLLVAAVAVGFIERERRQRSRRRRLERQVTERTRELAQERDTVAAQARKLTQLDRAKSELFANVSHEFRTPLTLSLGPLRDLIEGRHGMLEPPVLRELERVRGHSVRLLDLVNQLLDIARLEAGGFELRRTRGDLCDTVRRIGERFVALAERRRVKFAVTVPDSIVEANLDFEQLDKVLTNLLSNAFKFTRRGGRVTLTLEPPTGDRAAIAVRDTGCGIATSDLPRIFDRFYQADGAARQPVAGTGLGLALARDLLELHGGTLEAESVLDEGSTFTARLPLGGAAGGHLPDSSDTAAAAAPEVMSIAATGVTASAESPFEAVPFDPDPAADNGGLDDQSTRQVDVTTVLVVDDHPELRAYLRRHLSERYRVIEAGDGAAGLYKARRLLPDLVVSDVMMPEMDGYELTRALKQDSELDFVPVVLLTARAEAEDKLAGLGIGADDYLTKPFDVRELLARVDNLIAQRRRLRERFLREARLAAATEGTPTKAAVEARVQDHDFLNRVVAAIDAGLVDESFHIDTLARRLGLSRTVFYERLAEATDTSPARLILERRMARAAALLRDRANVSETAYAIGFKSVSHFSHRFRQHFGTTPSAFRAAV